MAVREIALPLEPWRCTECLKDLRDIECLHGEVSFHYDGPFEPPTYDVTFCDEECSNLWFGYRGLPCQTVAS